MYGYVRGTYGYRMDTYRYKFWVKQYKNPPKNHYLPYFPFNLSSQTPILPLASLTKVETHTINPHKKVETHRLESPLTSAAPRLSLGIASQQPVGLLFFFLSLFFCCSAAFFLCGVSSTWRVGIGCLD